MKRKKKIRCGIYDRVSSDLQVRNGLSLDTQKQLLTDYALSKGYEIVDYYVDEGITARKKLQNRKDFLRLLEDIKQDKIDLVLVTKLDRWFRNVRDYHNTQAILEAHNCNWKTVLEDYDTSTADGQLKINIMLAVAQNESDRTSERIKVVFDHKRRQKQHVTGAAPYGYILKDKKQVKDPLTREIVEDAFEYYFTTFSKRKTINYILEKYKDHEKPPTSYQINRFLTHEGYAGIYQGEENYCEAYITPKQHQKIMSMCDSKTYAGNHKPYIFSQLIRCPNCGTIMTGFTKKQKLKTGGVSEYRRYRCAKKFRDHNGAVISESVVETYMLSNVSQMLGRNVYEIKQAQKGTVPKDNTGKLRAEMDRLNLLYQKGRITDEYYESQYDILERKLKEEKEKNQIVSIEDYQPIIERFSGNWQELYSHLDSEHKNMFWKKYIKEIDIDKNTHKISGFKFMV